MPYLTIYSIYKRMRVLILLLLISCGSKYDGQPYTDYGPSDPQFNALKAASLNFFNVLNLDFMRRYWESL